MNNALLSSKNMCWCTPPDFFAELDREFHFELDPASTDKSAKCAKHFTPDDDGLKQDWGGIACSAIRHTAERSQTGYAKATKKAGSPAPPWLCSFLRGLTRRGRSSVSFCRHSVAESGKHRARVCHMAHIKAPEPAGPLLRRFR